MLYTNYTMEYEPFLFDNNGNYINQSNFFFEKTLFKEIKSNSSSFSLNSNDFEEIYIKNPPNIIELEEEEEKVTEEKGKENPINSTERTKTTAYKTILPVVLKENEKAKIFEIKKVKKSFIGRKRKNQFQLSNNDTVTDTDNKVHTKNEKDDMFTKLKRNGYNNSLKCVNYKLKKSKNPKLNSIKLKKIDNSVIIVSKKEENQALFKTELKDLFSNKLSKKYKYENPYYNKEKIDFILKQNDKEINSVIEKKFGDMIDIYVDKNKEVIDGFTKLKDDKEFLTKNKDKKYVKLFKDFAYNYEENVNKICPRRKRKNPQQTN